ncbi:MAG: DNA translocase FtsK 4TM domain-containing protein, partial [Chloroflexota bacterium]
MVVFSLVLFFSSMSRDQAAISGFHTFLGQMFGWGAMAVPIALFVIGGWLIVRHFGDEAPTVDPIRVAGVAIVLVTSLYFLQWFDSFSYNWDQLFIPDNPELSRDLLRFRLEQSYEVYQVGGGLIGAELYYYLTTTVTEIGGFLLMIFATIVGIMLITRMSAAEIMRAGAGMVLAMREGMKQRAVRKRAERKIAAQQAARERISMDNMAPAQPVPAMANASVGNAGSDDDRAIRMTIGGQAQTVSMNGQNGQYAQPNGQAVPAQVAYMPAIPQIPVQQVPQANSGNGIFGRLFGGRSNNGSTVAPPPAPVGLPDTPLPMDDGFSHFDAGPIRPVAAPDVARPTNTPAPQPEQPQRLGDMLSQPAANTNQASGQPQAMPSQAQPSREAQAEQEAEEVNDYLKQRQDRLNALREGKTGPLSQGAIARARQEDISDAYVPSSEGAREEAFDAQFGDGIPDAVQVAVPQQPAANNDFTPPSKLPSAQADADIQPRQQMLSVQPDQPISSEVRSTKQRPKYTLPDYSTLLSSGSEQEFDRERLLKQASTIEDTLAEFGAPGRVVEINTGPVITQYGVEPDYVSGRGGRKQRVKVSAIAGLDKDLQLALGARSIRVEAPVPGKGYVGVEVPNAESTLVSLRDVMDSPSFSKHKTPLAIALGQSVSGAPISADLSTMPHLLIAGTTGSGKSVCVNSIIASILSRNTPEQVKFIMVDPKRVELTGYNGIPHLVAPVVVELERIVGVLKWVTREMDARYKQFSEQGSRNIEDFNKHRDPATTDPMPYMVVIIDELADLMMLAPEETERTITRIAALARATGIHLVIATQRPSVDVVTGLIKANFPARIAFAVAGSVDSRVILDQPGAERLLGKGDMLYLSGDSPAPLRLQGVYVSDMEINNIVRYWKMQAIKQPAEDKLMRAELNLPRTNAGSSNTSRPSSSGGNGAFWDNNNDNSDLPLFASNNNASNGDSDDVELTRRELTGDVQDGNEDELYDKAVELVR